MTRHRLFADFNNADAHGRVRLNCAGTQDDLTKLGVALTDGMQIRLYDGDSLEADGTVLFSADESIWVAELDWKALQPAAERR